MRMKVVEPALPDRCIRRAADAWDTDVRDVCEEVHRLEAERVAAIAAVRAAMGRVATRPQGTQSVRAPGAVAGQTTGP